HIDLPRRRYAVADGAGNGRGRSRRGRRQLDRARRNRDHAEANPSSVEAARFRGYRDAGVNRVSLGVQALNDPDLKFLGRLHDVEQALHAIRLARETFPRLSFDLIYARPGQTVEAWASELRQAIGHAADHLSLYQLTIEEGTTFHVLQTAGKLTVPDQEQ